MMCHSQKCVKSQLWSIARLLDCPLPSPYRLANRLLNPICARPVIGRNKFFYHLAQNTLCMNLILFKKF